MDDDEYLPEEYLPEEYNPATTSQERIIWNNQAVHVLIREYKKYRTLFKNPAIKRRKIWAKIADKLQLLGYNFDAEQCEKKWRNLRNYYSINEGKDIVTWPLYPAMRSALQMPVNNAQYSEINESGSQLQVSLENENRNGFDKMEDEDSGPPAWFAKFLTQFREDEKEKLKMLEEMHEDIMKLENKKCSLLQTLIEKL